MFWGRNGERHAGVKTNNFVGLHCVMSHTDSPLSRSYNRGVVQQICTGAAEVQLPVQDQQSVGERINDGSIELLLHTVLSRH